MSLEDEVVALLKDQGLTLTTAESCTAGLLAGRVIDVAELLRYMKKDTLHIPTKLRKSFLAYVTIPKRLWRVKQGNGL